MPSRPLRALAERWRLPALLLAGLVGLALLASDAGDGFDQALTNARAARQCRTEEEKAIEG